MTQLTLKVHPAGSATDLLLATSQILAPEAREAGTGEPCSLKDWNVQADKDIRPGWAYGYGPRGKMAILSMDVDYSLHQLRISKTISSPSIRPEQKIIKLILQQQNRTTNQKKIGRN